MRRDRERDRETRRVQQNTNTQICPDTHTVFLDSIDVMHPGDMIRVLNEEFDKRTALHDAELYTQMAQLKMESSFQDFAASLDLLAHMIEERCGTRVPEAQLLSIIFNGLPQHADPLVVGERHPECRAPPHRSGA